MKSLRRYYKITIEDESHLSEIASRRFSVPSIVGIAIIALILLLVIAGLIVTVTPIRTLLPGYLKESQRGATEEGLLRLDSLMSVYERNQAYIDNFLKVTDTERIPGDSAAVSRTSRDLSSDSLLDASGAERKFVSQMEERERFNISVLAPLAADGMMFYPVSGDGIFTKESENKEEGEIILPANDNVHCAADGSVIALYYSAPEQGYVIVVQHNRGFVTSYSHVGTPLAGVGDIVNAGQIIAMAPKADSKGTHLFRMRMWHNGLPLIPFEYVGKKNAGGVNPVQRYEAPRGRL